MVSGNKCLPVLSVRRYPALLKPLAGDRNGVQDVRRVSIEKDFRSPETYSSDGSLKHGPVGGPRFPSTERFFVLKAKLRYVLSRTFARTVLEVVETLGPPGTPVTTPEVAAEFDCTQRTIYNRLDALVDDGQLDTKKVGANSRVWWQPPQDHGGDDPEAESRLTASTFRQLFKNVPGRYLIVEPDDYEIIAVSDAYLEATMTDRAEITGKTLFDVFPADPDDPDPEGAPRLRESLKRVKANTETDVMPVTYYPIPQPDSDSNEFEDRWWSPTNSPVVDESGEIDYIIHRVEDVTPVVRRLQADGDTDVLDRLDTRDSHLATDIMLRGRELHQAKEDAYERLRESEERYRTLFESMNEGYYIIEVLFDKDDEPVDYRFLETNPAFEEQTGLVDVEGNRIRELVPAHEDYWFEMCGRIARTGEPERFTDRAQHFGGRWFDGYAFRIGEPEDRTVAVLFDDITERKHTRLALERLTVASRELIDADVEMISNRVAELTRDTLDVAYAALWRYDKTDGEIQRYDSHTAPEADLGTVRLPDAFPDQVWQTFIGNETDVDNDIDLCESNSSASVLRSRVFVPLGRHGVICAGSTCAGTFDERLVDLAETVGATVETAWDRAESEQTLERQNEELTRLDRLNTLIRQVDQALVQAETIDAIDDAVCERLAESARYEFAWIGSYDPETEAVEPREWAGVDGRDLDGITRTRDDSVAGTSPFEVAIQRGEMQVVADIATDPQASPWREPTLKRGARSCLSIPLVYKESIYGVLTVYGGTPHKDEHETEVLAELGRTIAHAINAVETKATISTDSVVELTLRTETANTPLCRLARQLECVIEFEGAVPGSSDDEIVFFTVADVPTDDVLSAGERSFAISALTCLVDEDEGDDALFKAHVTDPTITSLFVPGNAVQQSLTIDEGTATGVVDLFQADDVTQHLDRIRESVPELDLLARQTRTRSPETRHTLAQTFEDRLTTRQWGVLHTAYRSGFFQSPRVQTGTELAETLDISQSTFTHHLREAEQKLCEMVFDTS